MSTYERNANRLTVFLLLIVLGAAVGGSVWLDGPIPIHFNAEGEPNRWGSPTTLLVLALVCLCMVGLFQFVRLTIRRISTDFLNVPGPRTTENILHQRQNVSQLMATIQMIVTSLFIGIIGQIIWASTHRQKQIVLWPSFLFIALIFICTVVAMFRAYRLAEKR